MTDASDVDHNPLVFINKVKGTNQRILRWSLYLQQFSLTICHIAGNANLLTDVLSKC
uniref:Reverse transcriptase RNase H-like domain-containing protein n=1 Tax=Octopus bimaculoides TaxID=37653 RepID=A0A0L8GXP3_OCTBM